MCHFISGVITQQTNIDDINKVGQRYSITFEKCDNNFVISQLKESEVYIKKNSKICDCGTELGMLKRMNLPETFRIEKSEIEKLNKKGWSESKINRWTEDRKKDVEKKRKQYNSRANELHTDIENWLTYLRNLFEQTSVSHFGLLLHWYKGGLENEKIKLNERRKVRISEVTEDILLNIDEDILYDIVR